MTRFRLFYCFLNQIKPDNLRFPKKHRLYIILAKEKNWRIQQLCGSFHKNGFQGLCFRNFWILIIIFMIFFFFFKYIYTQTNSHFIFGFVRNVWKEINTTPQTSCVCFSTWLIMAVEKALRNNIENTMGLLKPLFPRFPMNRWKIFKHTPLRLSTTVENE